MIRFLVVAAGGAVGAVLRYGITLRLQHWSPVFFPTGTLAVNVLGCLAIGALMTYFLDPRAGLPRELQLTLVTGLLGGLTTFSSFGFETLDLVERGMPQRAALNVALNLILGLGAVAIGRWAMRSVLGG
jgi:CrcB protein